MQGRRDAVTAPRPRILRAASMTARQRREAIIELIASGLERSVGEGGGETDGNVAYSEESGEEGLALSAVSRLSVRAGYTPDRNETKAGEHA